MANFVFKNGDKVNIGLRPFQVLDFELRRVVDFIDVDGQKTYYIPPDMTFTYYVEGTHNKVLNDIRKRDNLLTREQNQRYADLDGVLKTYDTFIKRDSPLPVHVSDYGVGFCPSCGGSVWQNADESKFCFRCGQRLKWEVKR